MTSAWVPPRSSYHLRIFAVSLVLVVLALAALLFGVEIEAVAPATGTITARDVREVRTVVAGLVEHRLRPGDEVPAGQTLATIRDDDLRSRFQEVEDQIKERESRGEPDTALLRERERLRERLRLAVLRVPEGDCSWLVLEVPDAPLQAVRPGDVVAVIVPVDPQTHQPRDLVARLNVDEKHWGSVAVGQRVRVHSAVHNHRLHGHVEAKVEHLEPLGEPAGRGDRQFHALAPIASAPFPLPLGSSFQAEVVVGRKLVYRVILEH
jgi:multidrug resistance efflux pump